MSDLHNEYEFDTVTLYLEEGELECAVIGDFFMGEQGYIALLPLDENGDPASEDIYLYRYEEDGDDHKIEYIEDEDELIAASEAFNTWMEEQDLLDSEE